MQPHRVLVAAEAFVDAETPATRSELFRAVIDLKEQARLHRERVVNESARDMNERGVDFQDGQRWLTLGRR